MITVNLQDRMNRLFRDPRGPEGQDESPTTAAFASPVDVYEDEHNITLKIEVPGIDEEDIDVRIGNNTLTVHGERKFEKEEKEENYRQVERQYGSFTRTFTIPNTVDHDNVQADFDKGVLKIKLAKKGEAEPRQIEVNVGSQRALEAKEPQKRLSVLRRERAFFDSNLNSFLERHSGKFVLIKGTEVLGFYPDARTAYRAGQEMFGDAPFFFGHVDRSLGAVAAEKLQKAS